MRPPSRPMIAVIAGREYASSDIAQNTFTDFLQTITVSQRNLCLAFPNLSWVGSSSKVPRLWCLGRRSANFRMTQRFCRSLGNNTNTITQSSDSVSWPNDFRLQHRSWKDAELSIAIVGPASEDRESRPGPGVPTRAVVQASMPPGGGKEPGGLDLRQGDLTL